MAKNGNLRTLTFNLDLQNQVPPPKSFALIQSTVYMRTKFGALGKRVTIIVISHLTIVSINSERRKSRIAPNNVLFEMKFVFPSLNSFSAFFVDLNSQWIYNTFVLILQDTWQVDSKTFGRKFRKLQHQ